MKPSLKEPSLDGLKFYASAPSHSARRRVARLLLTLRLKETQQ